jgi:hypothetical protein
VLSLLFGFMMDDRRLADVTARTPRVAGPDDGPGRCGDEGLVKLPIFVDQCVTIGRPDQSQGRIGPEMILGPFLQEGTLNDRRYLLG